VWRQTHQEASLLAPTCAAAHTPPVTPLARRCRPVYLLLNSIACAAIKRPAHGAVTSPPSVFSPSSMTEIEHSPLLPRFTGEPSPPPYCCNLACRMQPSSPSPFVAGVSSSDTAVMSPCKIVVPQSPCWSEATGRVNLYRQRL
jgi:hypothetical protein